MNGGTINKLTYEPDGIVLRIHGVGPLTDKVMMVKILPTNYRLKPGDLVWWYKDYLRWEGKVSRPFFLVDLDHSISTDNLKPADKTFWHV